MHSGLRGGNTGGKSQPSFFYESAKFNLGDEVGEG